MSTATSTSFTDIPVVSLANWHGDDRERTEIGTHLVQVMHEVGFLTLVDHGIDADFIARYFDSLEAFFALPDDTKALIDKRRSPHFRGWERVGAELTDNRVDYREQLDVSTENPPYSADAEPAYLRLDGPNQWLPEDVLPGFHALVDEFLVRFGHLADDLMSMIAVGLDLPADTFATLFGERPMAFAKLIAYPATPPGEAGVNAHHDAGFLTLLLQHGVSGLQALNRAGEWVDVPPVDGAIVVNLGDIISFWTGGYLRSTLHRVVPVDVPKERHALAYFCRPAFQTRLDPIPSPLLGGSVLETTDVEAPVDRNVTAGEWLAARVKKSIRSKGGMPGGY